MNKLIIVSLLKVEIFENNFTRCKERLSSDFYGYSGSEQTTKVMLSSTQRFCMEMQGRGAEFNFYLNYSGIDEVFGKAHHEVSA